MRTLFLTDTLPTAHLSDVAHKLNGCRTFSTIDLKKTYHQIPVAPEDVVKTAVITPFGIFEFKVMPFVLCNSAQTFRRYIDHVLRGLDFCYAYIYDILRASKSDAKHHKHLRILFERFCEYELSINVEKCIFGSLSGEYLGYSLSEQDIRPLPGRVQIILNFEKSGSMNFYRKSSQNAAEIQAPLHE